MFITAPLDWFSPHCKDQKTTHHGWPTQEDCRSFGGARYENNISLEMSHYLPECCQSKLTEGDNSSAYRWNDA